MTLQHSVMPLDVRVLCFFSRTVMAVLIQDAPALTFDSLARVLGGKDGSNGQRSRHTGTNSLQNLFCKSSSGPQ